MFCLCDVSASLSVTASLNYFVLLSVACILSWLLYQPIVTVILLAFAVSMLVTPTDKTVHSRVICWIAQKDCILVEISCSHSHTCSCGSKNWKQRTAIKATLSQTNCCRETV